MENKKGAVAAAVAQCIYLMLQKSFLVAMRSLAGGIPLAVGLSIGRQNAKAKFTECVLYRRWFDS